MNSDKQDDKIDKKELGLIIKTARLRKGLSQSGLAEKLGISEKHMSKIETGKNIPSLYTFLKTLEVLELSLGDFKIGISPVSYPNRDYLKKIINEASENQLNVYVDVIKALQVHL